MISNENAGIEETLVHPLLAAFVSKFLSSDLSEATPHLVPNSGLINGLS
jgi:hypothetical protein